jgi:drug/metabolite transporter (DMT)-like permease
MPTGIEWLVIASQAAASLHPILLKMVNVPLMTQILFRMGTYTSLSGIGAEAVDWTLAFGSFTAIFRSLTYSLINLLHIGSSYESYKYLSAGSALALYYTNPFINILGGALFLNERIKWQIIPLLLVAFVGVLLIAYAENQKDGGGEGVKNNTLYSVGTALAAALTESLIYFVVKTSSINSPIANMLQLYPMGFLALAAYSGVEGFKNVSGSPQQIGTIVMFNIFVGFLGYMLRFYAIPLLDTSIYSILTFIGVAMGYVWGLIFVGEKPSLIALLGAACITGSVFVLDMVKR